MSTVTILKIKWDNCFSFGTNNFIDLNKEALTQIIAPNGYGKSSIPLILEETMYNKNSKGAKKSDIPNRLVGTTYSSEVDFLVDDSVYKVKVDRGSTLKVKLFKDNEDISSHTATNTFKDIEELIGIDFKTFQQLVFQSTTNSLQFLSATDTARKKFLIDLFDLSEYTGLFEVFKNSVKTLGTECTTLESQVETINKWLSNNSGINLDKKDPLELPVRPDLSTEIGDLNSKLSNINFHNNKVKQNNTYKLKLDKIDIETLKSHNLSKLSYTGIQDELSQVKSNKTVADTTIKKLSALEDKCPTCFQDIDKEFYNKLLSDNTTSVAEYTKIIMELETRISDIKRNNALFDSTQEQINEWEKINSLIDSSISDNELNASNIAEELSQLKNTLAETEKEIDRVSKLNNDIIKHNSKIDIYLEQNEAFNNELAEAKAKLKVLVTKLKTLEVLKKAFSSNGLVAYKLENLVKDLEQYTNEYLAELSDGRFSIEFSISNDKLDVIVTDNGLEISINSPSSGEMARINISTLLAIRKLMSGISKNTINVLFLDEVISVLDDYGREKLVEVLLKEEGLNTFLVSHSWTHPLVDKLSIRQDEGISSIEYG